MGIHYTTTYVSTHPTHLSWESELYDVYTKQNNKINVNVHGGNVVATKFYMLQYYTCTCMYCYSLTHDKFTRGNTSPEDITAYGYGKLTPNSV